MIVCLNREATGAVTPPIPPPEVLIFPIYLMTEESLLDDGFYRLFNSTPWATENKAKLRKPDGTAMTLEEVTSRYLQDATLNLSGGYDADTELIFPSDSDWNIIFVDNVDMGTSCDLYTFDYFEYDPIGSPGVFALDIYIAHRNTNTSLNVDFPLTPNYSGIPFVKTDSWKIKEETPSVVFVDEIIYTMADIETT